MTIEEIQKELEQQLRTKYANSGASMKKIEEMIKKNPYLHKVSSIEPKLEIRNKDKVIAEIKKKVIEIDALCDLARENELNIKLGLERISLKGGNRKIIEYLDITPSASVKLLTIEYYGELYSSTNQNKDDV